MRFRSAETITVAGVVVAIAITTSMDATGLSVYSALPLLPLLVILAAVQQMRPSTLGAVRGWLPGYGLALLYPAMVLTVLAALAATAGEVDVSRARWPHLGLQLLLNGSIGTLAVLLTEEGFFRGWLWASLERAGMSVWKRLTWTSLVFAAWHISAVVLPTGFNPPAEQVPQFLINAAVMGAIWGFLRGLSGSSIVSSVSHSVWNAAAYSLFGFGSKIGALGIHNTALYGPEVGVAGLALNVMFLGLLIWRFKERFVGTA